MITIHIYKLNKYKYFFTTVYENSNSENEENKEYEYIGNVNVEDNTDKLSIHIQKTKYTSENTEYKFIILDNGVLFDDSIKKLNCTMKEQFLNCTNLTGYNHANSTRDLFSNVYCIDYEDVDCEINFITIKSQIICNFDVNLYLNNQSPKISSIVELDALLDNFDKEELDVYIINMPISTNAYETMRNIGSCMTTIDEYHIPEFGLSYNFHDEINILFGSKIENRYREIYWSTRYGEENHISLIKKTITGEKLKNTLTALKSYTNFKLNIYKLYNSVAEDENNEI